MARRVRLPKLISFLVLVVVGGGALMAVLAPQPSSVVPAGAPIFGTVDLFSTATSNSSPSTYSFGSAPGFVAESSLSTPPSTIVIGPGVSKTAMGSEQQTVSIVDSNVSEQQTSASGHSIELLCNLTLTVADPSTALQRAGAIAYALGGYVAYSSYQGAFATVTVRVPSQDYQEAITQLETLGKLVHSTSSSNDVSVQYTDLNATLQSLLTEQTSLLKLLNASNSVNATISIESVLQKTDAQINSVESNILQTSQLINYATVSVNLSQSSFAPLSVKLTATPLKGVSPLSVTFNALVQGGEPTHFVNYNFGDGTSAQGQQLIHQFTQAGRYNVSVSATDQSGNATQAWVVVNVTSPPAVSGLAAFASTIVGLFTRVVEAMAEVAVVVVPVGLLLYAVAAPAYKRYSRGREEPGESRSAQPQGGAG